VSVSFGRGAIRAIALTRAKHLELTALCHDAAEAFSRECLARLKALLPDYKALESPGRGNMCFPNWGAGTLIRCRPTSNAPNVRNASRLEKMATFLRSLRIWPSLPVSSQAARAHTSIGDPGNSRQKMARSEYARASAARISKKKRQAGENDMGMRRILSRPWQSAEANRAGSGISGYLRARMPIGCKTRRSPRSRGSDR